MSDPTTAAQATAPTTLDHSAGVGVEPVGAPPGEAREERVSSLWSDAWRDLRRNPVFIVASILIAFIVVMAIWPQLFTSVDPNRGDLAATRLAPSSEHWFGTDVVGRDVYARTIHGARPSLLVGVFTTLLVLAVGSLLGVVAGYYSKSDSWLSRLTDIFYSIPLVLGSVLVLVTLQPASPSFTQTVGLVVFALALLGWPVFFRLMRSQVLQVKQADYIQAARAMGAGGRRIILKHIVPNSLAPVIVVATISLGAYIGAEATLSFLGIGLQPPVVSWGIAISQSQDYIRVSPHLLLFPGAFVSITVLAFILMGDAVRDALDPKLR
jgi:oligopeptide transport system permease protein